MGATFIETEIIGKRASDLDRKFTKLQSEARAYYGMDPYSGSWANVPGVIVINYPDAPKRWTKKSKWAAAEYLAGRCEKWEKALAIKTSEGWIIGACVAT
jgi:hypothetical protein